jgi:hypothetical protein
VLLAGVAATILVAGFGDMTTALAARLGSAAPEALAVFAPDGLPQQAQYRTVAALFVLTLFVAWRRIARADADGEMLPAEIRIGALGVVIVFAVLAQAPYKLAARNQLPVALVGGLRCYVLGERGTEVRAFCPGWDVPRVRTVRSAAGVEPCGFEENLFRWTGGRACQVTR